MISFIANLTRRLSFNIHRTVVIVSVGFHFLPLFVSHPLIIPWIDSAFLDKLR
ncbi:hypothetical protein RchiOBHm_Chr1g0341951 [Rosa chinensis]|uniref:Uncharacterized protein n=1 Tax=Rosa chinensis TaxID=74649 RepID=A0A2P6SDV1_ROSCH|nr:hypothetical protein RchiOBHm_Chr1g0341951 [Rosa chinensis]